MKQIRILEEKTQFYCPATNKLIFDLEAEFFEASEALLFCYCESDGSFMYDSDWWEQELESCRKVLEEKNGLILEFEAFNFLLEQDYDKYPELVCYIVETKGGSPFNPTETLYFGIDMRFAQEDNIAQQLQDNPKTLYYSRKELTQDCYQILDSDQGVIMTHMNTPFPELSKESSQILLDDLNAIYNYNEKFHMLGGGSDEELRQSFGYCVLSTVEAYSKNDMFPELDITDQIQWDRLFRLSPGPPHLLSQLRATEQAREFLGKHWVDLPLNYSGSIEEMETDEVEFVPEETVNTIVKLVEAMNPEELIMVNVLYNFFDYFSITLSVLWVSGKIGDDEFIAAYWAFHHDENLYELNESDYEYPRFLINRLEYLRMLQQQYNQKDKSLTKL